MKDEINELIKFNSELENKYKNIPKKLIREVTENKEELEKQLIHDRNYWDGEGGRHYREIGSHYEDRMISYERKVKFYSDGCLEEGEWVRISPTCFYNDQNVGCLIC